MSLLQSSPWPRRWMKSVESHSAVDARARKVAESKHDADSRAKIVYGLALIRTICGLSQREVAKTMGTQQSAVSETEKGITDPRLSTLQRQARAIGCRVDVQLVPTSDEVKDAVFAIFVSSASWSQTNVYYKTNVRTELGRSDTVDHLPWDRDRLALPSAG